MEQLIEETTSATVTALMTQLKKHKMLKPNKDTTFEKIENLLYNYENFKTAIQSKLNQIELIKSEGVSRRSTSVILFTGNHGINTDTEVERSERKIEDIQASIENLENYLQFIDVALEKVRNDQYFGIISMKYFEGLSHESISIELDCDVSTVVRNKNRLINTLKIYLFPDESVMEFLY